MCGFTSYTEWDFFPYCEGRLEHFNSAQSLSRSCAISFVLAEERRAATTKLEKLDRYVKSNMLENTHGTDDAPQTNFELLRSSTQLILVEQ